MTLVFDQSLTASTANFASPTTTLNFNVSTSGPGRVVFIALQLSTTGTPATASVSGGGLTWLRRTSLGNSGANFGLLEFWYAKAPSQLTNANITVTSSVLAYAILAATFSYSGVSPQIFDTNGSLPATLQTGASGGALSLTVSTTQAHDIVFGVIGSATLGQDFSLTSGFSLFFLDSNYTFAGYNSVWVERGGFSSAQSGLVIAPAAPSNTDSLNFFVDAITSDSASPPSNAVGISDTWFGPTATFVDFTIPSNRRSFISLSGGAQNLGSNGQNPFVGVPPVFLTANGPPSTFAQNNGRGGPFIISGGTLGAAASNPPPSSVATTTVEPYSPGQGVLGDYQSGNLYAFNPATLTDNGAQRKWVRRWRALEQTNFTTDRYNYLAINMQTGIGVPDGTNPQMVLRWSDDGGHTWSNERIKPVGPLGATSFRIKFNRLGATRRFVGATRIFELSSTDPFSVALVDAEVDAT